jgi:uncharacterized membrane protein YgcG
MKPLSPLRNAPRAAAALVTTLVLLAVLSVPISAQRSLEITHFDATVEVEPSGWIDVREQIEVRFEGSWNGIFRMIPVEFRTEQGFSYRLRLDDVSVTGPDGEPYEYWSSRQRHYRELKIRVPGASNATRTVVIHYRVPNALKFWDEYDELYWNVTGDEWEMPIRAATATIILPEGADGTRTASWTGGYGATENAATVRTIERGFYFENQQGLNFREGMTIAVAWNPGVVARPTATSRIVAFLRANWLFALPFLSFFLMWRLWYRKGRDPAKRPISPAYEPPDGLTPAEAGTLLDNRPDMRDLTAGLVDLAVRGYLRIEEVDAEGVLAGLLGKPDYALVGLRSREDWKELKLHERELLRGVFGAGSGQPGRVLMSSLQNEFYEHLPDIKEEVFAELLSRGYYTRSPDGVLAMYMALGVAVLVIGIGGGIPLAEFLQMSQLTAVLAGIFTALPVFGFGVFMPARTEEGTRTLERILGFEEFLSRVETERYRRMVTSPEMFEKYLPYAMAFGVEQKWASAFDDIYKEPPDWYRGRWDRGFRPIYFANSMSSMSSSAATTLASRPRSSGGSGFSGGGGGGFSGGGFGGGGGGGW